MKSKNPSAGSAEPSWFEWQTGLLRLVEMLDEDSDVVGVAFQLHGTKGWDDVGVRFRNGTTRLFQMKHSRSDDTLTFGDLMAAGEDTAPSLLRALALAWKNEHSVRGKVECVLVTNRTAGPNWYKGRPPLAEFFTKIKARTDSVATIGDVRWDGEDERYPGAWELFLAELSDLEPAEQLAFLKALELETSAPDLAALEVLLKERLAALTGLPQSSVQTLFNTLHAHLRKWACHSRREAEWLGCGWPMPSDSDGVVLSSYASTASITRPVRAGKTSLNFWKPCLRLRRSRLTSDSSSLASRRNPTPNILSFCGTRTLP